MKSIGTLSLVACDSGTAFAERVATKISEILRREEGKRNFKITDSTEVIFPNKEVKTIINENIRGNDVYVIQCIDDPLSERSVNDNLMALLTAINAAYQSHAARLTAVMPQFPYSRQERKKAREGITARQVARFLEVSGSDAVITLDIHTEAIQGFFEKAILEDLHASRPIIEYFCSKYPTDNLVAVGPDVGGAERARFFSKELHAGLAIIDKARDYSKIGKVETMRLVGDAKGKDAFIGDDMIATGGTIINAATLLKEGGARDIYVACSLPFFNGKAIDRLGDANAQGLIKTVIGTDAVFRGEKFIHEHPWYEEVSVAPLFAQVIYNINTRQSVSKLLK